MKRVSSPNVVSKCKGRFRYHSTILSKAFIISQQLMVQCVTYTYTEKKHNKITIVKVIEKSTMSTFIINCLLNMRYTVARQFVTDFIQRPAMKNEINCIVHRVIGSVAYISDDFAIRYKYIISVRERARDILYFFFVFVRTLQHHRASINGKIPNLSNLITNLGLNNLVV